MAKSLKDGKSTHYTEDRTTLLSSTQAPSNDKGSIDPGSATGPHSLKTTNIVSPSTDTATSRKVFSKDKYKFNQKQASSSYDERPPKTNTVQLDFDKSTDKQSQGFQKISPRQKTSRVKTPRDNKATAIGSSQNLRDSQSLISHEVDPVQKSPMNDGNEGGKSEMSDLSAAMQKVKLTLVYALCLIQFLTNCALSQLSPFYPLKAREKGISVIWIGFVLGFFACLQIVSSALIGKNMHKLEGGRHVLIMIGSLLLIAQIAIMGLVDYIDDAYFFLFWSFFAQGLGGFGGGANLTASMAILSSFDGQEREMYIGWIEAANGIGLLFGPLIGAFLFSMGGYKTPFFTFAFIYIAFYPCIVGALYSYNKQKKLVEERIGRKTAEGEDEQKKDQVKVSALIKYPRFLFGLFSQMILLMSIQYLAPNLAIHLHHFGYSAIVIGCAYAIPAILYACTCPFIYLLTQRMRKRGVILIGFLMITMAMQMIGGSDSLFEFQKQPVFIFLGLCLIGLSCGMISIPVLPEMLECIEEDEELSKKYDMESIENVISGLFISFQSIGEAVGPIAASALSEQYGFQTAQEVYCAFLAIFTFFYFVTCGCCTMFGQEPVKPEFIDDDMQPLQQEGGSYHTEGEGQVEMKKYSIGATTHEEELMDFQRQSGWPFQPESEREMKEIR